MDPRPEHNRERLNTPEDGELFKEVIPAEREKALKSEPPLTPIEFPKPKAEAPPNPSKPGSENHAVAEDPTKLLERLMNGSDPFTASSELEDLIKE